MLIEYRPLVYLFSILFKRRISNIQHGMANDQGRKSLRSIVPFLLFVIGNSVLPFRVYCRLANRHIQFTDGIQIKAPAYLEIGYSVLDIGYSGFTLE